MNTNVKYKQERVGDFIQMYSGNFFYPLDPRPDDISIRDIAHSLSGLPRFTAHSEKFYTVGEHSIHCANVAKVMGLTTLQQLYALLHDASECVVNDVARPVKQNLYQYKKLEDNIMKVIWESMGLPAPSEEDYKLVKIIDNTLLLNEMFQLMPNDNLSIPNVEHELINVDLSKEYSRSDIKGMFLMKYTELMGEYLDEKEETR